MGTAVDTAKMSERGQIIIPKGIRESVGAGTSSVFAFAAIDGDTIVMKKLDTSKLVAEFRAMRKKARKLTRKEIEAEIHASRGD
jgi:bifunctional DNA-binding transcriptional regulator/antitoxin component of YhaV-PrlF toxin-antitoxin module